ncbi:MAG: GMC family oxidoreductase [Maricaulaceae bacterium]|jgi:choline dehydrogenase-like flavoprotein
MQVERLSSLEPDTVIEADVAIVGGGPAGLTVARELIGSSLKVLILESGELDADCPVRAELNTVENVGEPKSDAQWAKRNEIFGGAASSWTDNTQPFEVRNRVLGGSSHTWAGKSAAFEPIDFKARDWVPHSGWPITRDELEPHIDRAAEALNLGPNRYDDSFWELIGAEPPEPGFNQELLSSFFWQFARSRLDNMDIMRLGPEFLAQDAPNVRVLLDATVTHINTNESGSALEELEIASISGRRAQVKATAVVLAAGAVENARLLLASNRIRPQGVGNDHDVVGRFLMEHPSATIARFKPEDFNAIVDRFGFYGVTHGGRAHMYMHGLTLSEEVQEREGLLNCALYMSEHRAPDDPWDAIKRLVRRNSETPLSDAWAVAKSPALLAKGLGRRAFQSNAMPQPVKDAVVNFMIARNPNFVVREFQSRGIPHKLSGLVVDAISEQRPNPDSRITLSPQTDPLGVPLPRADWRINEQERRSVVRLGQLMVEEFPRVGLPAPVLEDWVAESRPEDGVFIDMAHPIGTTRMSTDPKTGVVDENCKVHGVKGLYVAGGSVFPTNGHANPTLMIMSVAIRLADHLRSSFGKIAGGAIAASLALLMPSAEYLLLEFE